MRVCTPLLATFAERLEVDVFVAVPGVALSNAVFDHDVHKYTSKEQFSNYNPPRKHHVH